MQIVASCSDTLNSNAGGQWGAIVVVAFAVFLLFDIGLTVYTINSSVKKAEVKSV